MSAVQTDGLGKQTTRHLNLTVTLAEVWGEEKVSRSRAAREVDRQDHKRATGEAIKASVRMGRPPGPAEPTRLPFAGKSPREYSQFRLKTKDGRAYLHMSGQGTTVLRADAWIGSEKQLRTMRERSAEAKAMSIVGVAS